MVQGIEHSIRLLGEASVQFGGQRFDLSNEKRFQFLAYLAYEGNWVSRDKLADLFWGDTDTQAAKQNLRQLLRRAQEVSWLNGLEAERHRIRWPIHSDAVAFAKAVQNQTYEEALNLYQGRLLKGLDSYEDNGFSLWLETEREQLHGLFRRALFQRVGELQGAGKYAEASDHLERLLGEDGFDEEALSALMRLTREAGDPLRGLRVYRSFAERLRREMGLEPTSATQQLAQALEAEPSLPPLPWTETPTSVLPTPTTSFIGRDFELAEIVNLLSNPNCRLLTLLGPGGVGKTRLSLQIAAELAPRFSHGVAFVPLETLTNPEAIPVAIAETLNISLRGSEPPLVQLCKVMGSQKRLLVLDNFEHLVEGAAVISELLSKCPELLILSTSRERLATPEEWVLNIQGLTLANKGASLEEALANDAVTLFVERARRVRPGFILTQTDLPHVLHICQLVEGFPLGIELASVWVRLMSCEEIAQEIQGNMDFLSGSNTGPERHRSIRAVFDHSWKLLKPIEQTVLKKLSVFRGGFSREAAKLVAGANIAVLAALVDKSLLRSSGANRYDAHPLLYQYAQEQLEQNPQELAQTRAKHSEYFFQLLDSFSSTLQQRSSLDAIGLEFENIRVCWQWAAKHGGEKQLKLSVKTLRFYCETLAKTYEGIGLFKEAILLLGENQPSKQATLGTLWANMAWFNHRLGKRVVAAEQAQRGLDLLTPLDDYDGMFGAHNTLGSIAWRNGDFLQARAHYQKATEYAILVQNESPANLLNNLALVERALGNYPQAIQSLQEAIAINREEKRFTWLISNLGNLGQVYQFAQRHQEAYQVFQEALDLVRQTGISDSEASLLRDLGSAAMHLGDDKRAGELLHQSLKLVREINLRSVEIATLASLGDLALKQQNLEEASKFYWASAEVALSIAERPRIAMTLINFAKVEITKGEHPLARYLLNLVLEYPAMEAWSREKARRLLAQLGESTLAQTTLPELDDNLKRIIAKLTQP